ncbi:MAG: metal-dependent hydrolase [Bacteroidales bacterium]
MDSLTQVVLGAATGEAVLGKKLGNRAVLWGAFAGTLPDLDVIPGMFLDTSDRLLFHRGFSHSIVFVIVATAFFSWLFGRIYRKKEITHGEWAVFFGMIFTVSILIDAFTTYGTQLLWPLKYRFEFNTIFVVDPLFTLPLLITTVWLMFRRKESALRRKLNRAGILISVIYLLFTIVNKQVMNGIFEQSLKEQGIGFSEIRTNPTAMNQILWTAVAETENGFYTGYYSYFDDDRKISFDYDHRNESLIGPFTNYPPVEKILRFTKDYYTVERLGQDFLVNDLRFGEVRNWETGRGQYIFQYKISLDKGQVVVDEVEKSFGNATELLAQLWQRMLGKEYE